MTLHWKHTLCAILPVAGLLFTAPVVTAYDDESGRYDRDDRYRDEERYDRDDRYRDEERSDRDNRYGRAQSAGQMSEQDLRSFEHYLDTHDETAQILYQNPEFITNRRFVRQHEALHDWLANHPEAAETLRANPDKYLWRERNTSAADFLQQLFGSHR